MSMNYFAQDGNYGDADSLLIFDTTLWSEDEWMEIEEAGDFNRTEIAQDIAQRHLDEGTL